MTTILSAAVIALLICLLFLQQRATSQMLETIHQRSDQSQRDWGTKALQRAEQSSTKAIAGQQKTIDSLCRVFLAQMSPQTQTEQPRQEELQLEWETALHPAEVAESQEQKLERRRAQWQLMMGQSMQSSSGGAVPKEQVAQEVLAMRNGVEPPPTEQLVNLEYDPSP